MNLLSMHDMHTVSYGNRRCETETDDIFYESKGSPKLSLIDFKEHRQKILAKV